MTDETLKYMKILQPFFKEKMGMTTAYDDWWWAEGVRIVIPLTIDDRHPERGLLGMIKGAIELYTVSGNTDQSLWRCRRQPLLCDYAEEHTTEADTPTLAILKALCVQEGLPYETQ